MQKLLKLVNDPQKYFKLAINLTLQRLTRLFKNSAFFMQGQMDIHPKSRWHIPEFIENTGGFSPNPDETSVNRKIFNLEPWDNTRRDMIILLLRTLLHNNIQGEMAEVGVYKGTTSRLIHHYMPERKFHLFDTFEGFGERSTSIEKNSSGLSVSDSLFADTDMGKVKEFLSSKNDNTCFYKGYFPDTIPEEMKLSRFAFVHLDADLFEPTAEGLKFFYPRMASGGFILVHDYNAWPGARKAVDEFFNQKNEIPIPMPDKSGSVLIQVFN